MNEFDWPTAVGYGHEVVHTAVLEWMLNNDEIGPELGERLGLGRISNIEASRERKVGRSKRVADLVAEFDDSLGSRTTLAVETKVDSNGFHKKDQLRGILDSPAGPCSGLFFALGVTHLCLTKDDLGQDADLKGHWSVIGPRDWADHLDGLTIAGRVPGLKSYVGRVLAEAEVHEEARRTARSDSPRDDIGDREIMAGRSIEDFAWLLEVRLALSSTPDLAADRWFPYKNQSGPLMGVFPAEWRRNAHDAFLEFVCDRKGDRSLCLKIGGHPFSELRESVGAAAIESTAMVRPERKSRANAGTATVARLPLTDTRASSAAAQTRKAYETLFGILPDLLC